jgi:outer membrane protein assembly factor BamE (lipoprotein component of BamABCDE complex)
MKIWLIAALSLLLMACAGTTARIEPARLKEVQKGHTTVTEIVSQFGRPSVLSRNPDGTQTALYVYNDGQSSGTNIVPLIASTPRDAVTFYFDTNGVLTDMKSTQANANAPAPAVTRVEPATAKSAPAEPNKSTPAASGKPAPNTEKPASSDKWSLPSWLPSSSEQKR